MKEAARNLEVVMGMPVAAITESPDPRGTSGEITEILEILEKIKITPAGRATIITGGVKIEIIAKSPAGTPRKGQTKKNNCKGHRKEKNCDGPFLHAIIGGFT